jgi:LAS superfamily LD-carboxypeptidase LdcB
MRYTLYDNGEIVGQSETILIDKCKVIESIAPIIIAMKEAAQRDGVKLTLAAGLRTWDEQFALRKQNVKDKSKVNDTAYLTSAPASAFSPFTAKPGWSNHHDGTAYDFNVSSNPSAYAWLIKNGLSFRMIRTVASERWHWEYRPTQKNPFAFVQKNDPSWDGLAHTIVFGMAHTIILK